ncbi:MAG: polymer-forming cytoskeletal protein [Deltaproteobacteria bacterium]|nr:polymer-forming cytoskeletal protein [Deltaproteobacteria bacterium]MCL5276976.1 polymer-forming cytoskeletal protein [Deltaproteobacteria bacterium]
MFDKKENNVKPEEIHTIIGKESTFEGKLIFDGVVRIDGIFKGSIQSRGKLLIGESAKIEAEIETGSLILNGEMNGNITAHERVEIKGKGRFTGNINSPSLTIEEGALFNGTSTMDKKKTSTGLKEIS